MANSMMMDRGMMSMGTMGMGGPMMGGTAAMPSSPGMMMIPRCTMKMTKMDGGMKIECVCEDAASASMLQNLCAMLPGGMCSLCAMMNGMMACCCNMMMGMTRCEMTDDGVCIMCTSGDAKCAAMIQACCDTMCCMMASGCTCCVMMNNMPICCG